MIYDTVALYLEIWERDKEELLAKGWEQTPDKEGNPYVKDGIVYLRKIYEKEVDQE